MRSPCAGVLLLIASSLFPPQAPLAQTSNVGIPVAPAHDSSEAQPRIISDHAGGAFVGFIGEQDTLYVARLRSDATLDPAWTSLKVRKLAITQPSGTRFAWLRPSTVVAFTDRYFGDGAPTELLYRQKTDTGVVQPDPPHAVNSYLAAAVVEQPNGTVLISGLGSDPDNTLVAQLRTAYITSAGALVEGFGVGLAGRQSTGVCRATLADGGGAWVVSEVYGIAEGNSNDLVAARLNANGSAALSPSFRVISNAARDQRNAALTTDGAGGMIVAWQDARTLATGDDIYAIRLLADGSLATGWTAGGKVLCNATSTQVLPAIASDGSGGAWIAWADSRNGDSDIFFTHVLGNGTLAPGFPAGGASLCGAVGGQIDVELAADGAGGFFALWLDERDGERDIFGHHVAANGSAVAGWVPGGLPICTNPAMQHTPRLLVLDPHRAMAAWSDSRTGKEKVYAAVIPDPVLSAPPLAGRSLSLRAARATMKGEVELLLDAAEGAPVEIALFDVGGRVVARRRVEAGGSAVAVRLGGELAPGLYLARASQGGRHADCRAIVVR